MALHRLRLEALMVGIELRDHLSRPPWYDDAACHGVGTGAFFLGKGQRRPTPAIQELCRSCPVREPCLSYALADPDVRGIWGGTTDVERRVLRPTRPPERALRHLGQKGGAVLASKLRPVRRCRG